MQFRLSGTVAGVYPMDGEALVVDYGGPYGIRATLEAKDRYYEDIDEHEPYLDITVLGERNADPAVQKGFEALANGDLPDGSSEPRWWGYDAPDEDGRVLRWHGTRRPNAIPELAALPGPTRAFVEEVERDLTEAARRVIDLGRWRFGVRGPHDPLPSVRIEWSLDGAVWRSMPDRSGLHLWFEPSLKLSSDTKGIIEEWLASGVSEPVAHQLWREAWEQRVANPRSALIVGVAAAEIGTKQWVSEVVPSASWFVEERTAPPVERILRHYLPAALEGKAEFPIKALPNTGFISDIAIGVDARNRTVHRFRSKIGDQTEKVDSREKKVRALAELRDPDVLEELLLKVRDLLWFLDYYRGYPWALERVRKDSLAAWRLNGNGVS